MIRAATSPTPRNDTTGGRPELDVIWTLAVLALEDVRIVELVRLPSCTSTSHRMIAIASVIASERSERADLVVSTG